MSLVEKLKSGCIQEQKRWSGDCGEMSLVDEHKTDAVMAEAAKKIEELQKTIHTLRAELKKTRAVICNTADTVKAFCEQAEKARADWHAAENELWLGELREKIEKLREQRDRAMQIAYDLLDYTSISESDWSLYVDDLRNIIKNVNSLSDEISKEKWEE